MYLIDHGDLKVMLYVYPFISLRPPAIVFVNSKMGALLLADAINKVQAQSYVSR